MADNPFSHVRYDIETLPYIGPLFSRNIRKDQVSCILDVVTHLQQKRNGREVRNTLHRWLRNPKANTVLPDGTRVSAVNQSAFNTIVDLMQFANKNPKRFYLSKAPFSPKSLIPSKFKCRKRKK